MTGDGIRAMGTREFRMLLAGLSDQSRYRQALGQGPAATMRTAEESSAFLRSMR